MCRHGQYTSNEIQLPTQGKRSSNGRGRLKDQLKRLFSLSNRMICCLLSVLKSLKLLGFLLHLGRENCGDLHLLFGRGGSPGMVLSMESGSSNGRAANGGGQAPESTGTAAGSSARLSFRVPSGSAATSLRDRGDAGSSIPVPGAGASPPGSRTRTRSRRGESKPAGNLDCL